MWQHVCYVSDHFFFNKLSFSFVFGFLLRISAGFHRHYLLAQLPISLRHCRYHTSTKHGFRSHMKISCSYMFVVVRNGFPASLPYRLAQLLTSHHHCCIHTPTNTACCLQTSHTQLFYMYPPQQGASQPFFYVSCADHNTIPFNDGLLDFFSLAEW